MAIKMSDLRNLDVNNIGAWPGVLKAIVILLICAGVVAAGFYVDTQDQLIAMENERKRGTTSCVPTSCASRRRPRTSSPSSSSSRR